MKRLLPLLLTITCAATAAARVISYAPYTDQLAVRGFHERTTRHFPLIESAAANVYDGLVHNGQVVLYDSTGAEAPRVIFPQNGGQETIRVAAISQKRHDQEPLILVVTATGTHLSRNGGRSWRRIEELDGLTSQITRSLDRGGPWTQGLGATVRIGSGIYPFVVSYHQAIYAISETRPPKLLYIGPTAANTLLGQNRAGTQFLILTHRNTLITVGFDGRWHPAGTVPHAPVAGWIADDGSIYTADASSVYRYQNRRAELVASSSLPVSFAVPTHDFGGFWLVEHKKKETTILSRYTPAHGLEQQWEDSDAPEIEALHPNASGDALLIQVHRERAKTATFIDPALAVWRVGDPAPEAYDELFLNEGPRKGFVHVDVEEVAAGKPFVFDSGFVRPAPPDVVISPPPGAPPSGGGGGGGGDVVQEWGIVRAALEQRLVIQGLTRAADLVLTNPADAPQTVRLEFGDRNATIELEANETRVIRGALATLFGIEDGSGALHLLPQWGVKAVAYMPGYLVQAVDVFAVAGPRFPVSFAGAVPAGSFQSSLVLTDTTGLGADVDVRKSGPGWIVQPLRGSLITGVVATDNFSGDAVYFSPDLPASSPRTLPLLANTATMVSDLYLFNNSSRDRPIYLEAKPYDGQWPRGMVFWLKPYQSQIIENPLKTLFNLEGLARLRYISVAPQGDSTGVRVTSRAYTNASGGGTLGTALPPLNNFQSVTAEESLEIPGILNGYKASVGLVELSPNPRNQPSTVKISIRDERGNVLDAFTVVVPPAGGILIDDLFDSRGITQPLAAKVTVEAFDDWGLVGAYAIVTDRVTGDPSYLGAHLAPKPK